METATQLQFLQRAYSSALNSGHIFPGAAAAEAALESSWGTSKLAVQANNLFGLKKSTTWTGNTVILPTREYVKETGTWITILATWPVFSTWADCMAARMHTLHTVACYGDALKANRPEQFIERVSIHWSTGPNRTDEVLAIFHAHRDILDLKQETKACSITP